MKVDLHVHTSHSYDGISSPEEMVDSAISKKLDAICITDHHEVAGATRAMKYAFDKSILIIPGIEVTTKAGHILGINVKRKINSDLSAKEAVRKIREQGGLAVIAHPFAWPWNFWGVNKKLGLYMRFKSFFQNSPDFCDGIEVLNAAAYRWANLKASDFAEKHSMPGTAGSDAHISPFVGKSYVEFEKNLSVERIIDSLKKKEGKVVKDVNLKDRVKYFSNYFKEMEKGRVERAKSRYLWPAAQQNQYEESN